MCGRISHSTSLPKASGPFDERFVYRLTAEGKKLLTEHERANGRPALSEARCTPAVTEALDGEAWSNRKRQRRKEARTRGERLGTCVAVGELLGSPSPLSPTTSHATPFAFLISRTAA